MSTTASCFAQVLSLVDRDDFARAVIDRGGERGAKGFSCWDQFVAMMFCQMGGANSLREICGGLATALGKLVHLGMEEAPRALDAGLRQRASALAGVRGRLLQRAGPVSGVAATQKRKFRFKNPLRSLDATVIDLCLAVVRLGASSAGRRGRSSCTCMLDHQGYLPCWALVTDGKTHEVKAAQRLSLRPGHDRGDGPGLQRLRALRALDATRASSSSRALKDNAVYEVVERARRARSGATSSPTRRSA